MSSFIKHYEMNFIKIVNGKDTLFKVRKEINVFNTVDANKSIYILIENNIPTFRGLSYSLSDIYTLEFESMNEIYSVSITDHITTFYYKYCLDAEHFSKLEPKFISEEEVMPLMLL